MAKSMPRHSIHTLTESDVALASSLVKKRLSDKAFFASVAVAEPSKSEQKNGNGSDRKLRLNGFEYLGPENCDGGFEATVDLDSQDVQLRRIVSGCRQCDSDYQGRR